MLVSPMMKQYQDAKSACPDALLLFRMGDFYELFHEDAKTAARVLNLALTSRDKGENATPMAGFPHHQLESYLGKLITAGFRVAICDQVEDARAAKGLVRREITRVVTAGTVTDDALLDPRSSNYLAAIVPADASIGLAWVELSTGRFQAACIPLARIDDELARIEPAECLAAEDTQLPPAFGRSAGHAATRLGLFHRRGERHTAVTFRHGQPRGLRIYRRRRARGPGRRSRAGLSGRNTEGVARAHRPTSALLVGRGLGNRRRHAAQPGDHRHAARRPARRFAVGRDGSHGHVDGLAAVGRLARQSAGRRGPDRRTTRRRGGAGGRRIALRRARRTVARDLRSGTVARARHNRPGQPCAI